ncbi:glycosyltransferase family 4 protein [Stenotrophomonas maltophilia]|jgi:glycosyltransferase involved in cell wall biosynthesis|uniref:glycosyltransferase family 4 protein n=1 Tax=Stenotrophomonas maltophilia TaxID=40324 RepID=UPI0015F558EB|nr:glycosyltransferase family 4 protein [Stenotrophomonas maltophilia]
MLLVWHEAGNPLYVDRFHALSEHFELTVYGFKEFQGVSFSKPVLDHGNFVFELFRPIFAAHWLTVFSFSLLWRAWRGRFETIYVHQEPHSLLAFLLVLFCRESAIYLDAAVINKRLNFGGLNPFERYVYRRTSGIFYRNDDVRSVLRFRGCPDSKLVQRLGNGVSSRTFYDKGVDAREELTGFPASGTLVVGYAGRIWGYKGVEILGAIAAMPGVSAVACGPVWDEELAASLAARGVILYPKLDKDELVSFYSSIDIFILPSIPSPNWVEQFGRVVVESVFCGTPAIGSSAGFIPSLVGKAQVFDAYRPGEALPLIDRLRNSALRAELLAEQRSRLMDEYSWEGIASAVRKRIVPNSLVENSTYER